MSASGCVFSTTAGRDRPAPFAIRARRLLAFLSSCGGDAGDNSPGMGEDLESVGTRDGGKRDAGGVRDPSAPSCVLHICRARTVILVAAES